MREALLVIKNALLRIQLQKDEMSELAIQTNEKMIHLWVVNELRMCIIMYPLNLVHKDSLKINQR